MSRKNKDKHGKKKIDAVAENMERQVTCKVDN